MLITQLKDREAIEAQIYGKAFVINCHGCKEVHFPVSEAEALQKAVSEHQAVPYEAKELAEDDKQEG